MTAPQMVSISIPGKPVAFARAGSHGSHRYTPGPQAGYMMVVATIAKASMARAGYKPFKGPVELTYRATYEYPKTWSEKRRAETYFRTAAPDCSNLVKLAEDALIGIVFDDDRQVQLGPVQKVYGERDGVVITITSLSAADSQQSEEVGA